MIAGGQHGSPDARDQPPAENVDERRFSPLPNDFLLITTEFGTLFHRSLTATIPDLATLVVLHRLFEAAIGYVLINLGTANLLTTTHQKDLSLFATHQRTQDFIDEPVLD